MAGTTDGAGHLTATYRYGASGEMLYGAPKYENVYGYNGESYNSNIKSQYLRARYYIVSVAAFLTRDSYLGEVVRPLTLNRYGYCLGNPVCYVDPSGHWIYEEELEQLRVGHGRMLAEALVSGRLKDVPQLSEMTMFLSALRELESANATVDYALQYNYRGTLVEREYVWIVEQIAEQRNQGYACELYIGENRLRNLGWKEEGLSEFTLQLNRTLIQYGITNETSKSMYLATIAMESNSGKWLTEKYNTGYFDHKTYGYNTRGAGLIQLTGSIQEEFLEYLANTLSEDSSERREVQKYLDGFYTINKVNAKGDSIISYENKYNVTDFIASNYSIEASAWFWGVGKETTLYYEVEGLAAKVVDNSDIREVKVSLNEYIEMLHGKGNKSVFGFAILCKWLKMEDRKASGDSAVRPACKYAP